MSAGRESHLYAGAIRRGRSGRTESTLGFFGWNGSLGQASEESASARKVGDVNAAVFVCIYTSILTSLSYGGLRTVAG